MRYITLLIVLAIGFLSFTYPKRMDKKIRKEIKNTLKTETFKLNPISVNTEIGLPLLILDESFFKIEEENNLKGYLYYGQSFGKAANFDFIVIFDSELVITKIKLMAYRESYGGEIGSLRWLKQFIGLTPKSSVVFKKDIAAISGATISANSLTQTVNKLLKTIEILKQKNIL